jgi:hypothetical protein
LLVAFCVRAKSVIRAAIAIPACAAILVTTVVAPEFAYCEPPPFDLQNPYALDDGGCDHSIDEIAFTWSILLLAVTAVAVIVSTGTNSWKVIAGAFASASSTFLGIAVIQVLFAGQSFKSLFRIEMLVTCVITAAIGAAASWAANKWWHIGRETA